MNSEGVWGRLEKYSPALLNPHIFLLSFSGGASMACACAELVAAFNKLGAKMISEVWQALLWHHERCDSPYSAPRVMLYNLICKTWVAGQYR